MIFHFVISKLQKNQLEFLVHLCRNKGLEHQVLMGKTEGKSDKERRRTTHKDNWKLLTNEKNAGNLLQKAHDREYWRTSIFNACNQIRHNK